MAATRDTGQMSVALGPKFLMLLY